MCVWSLGQEVPLEKGMVTHSSTLRSPRDREAWQATVHSVAKSQIWLKWLSMHVRVCVCVCARAHARAQGRRLACAVLSFSRGPSQPRDQTHISCVSWVGRWNLYHCATWKKLEIPTILNQESFRCLLDVQVDKQYKGKSSRHLTYTFNN